MVKKFNEAMEFREDGKVVSMNLKTQEVQYEYEVVEDVVADGIRTIKLKPSDRDSEMKVKRQELVNTLLAKLGEKDSKAFATLLQNAINEFGYDIVEELHRQAVIEDKPVRTRRGCFEIAIGRGISTSSIVPLH